MLERPGPPQPFECLVEWTGAVLPGFVSPAPLYISAALTLYQELHVGTKMLLLRGLFIQFHLPVEYTTMRLKFSVRSIKGERFQYLASHILPLFLMYCFSHISIGSVLHPSRSTRD